MGNILTFSGRSITAKGLNINALPNQEKLQSCFFDVDYKNLELLKNVQTFDMQEPILLYPGCGVDILFPLHYLETLFPETKKARFLFVDVDPNLQTIKTILDDVGIHFEEKKNAIRFYWKQKLITLIFIQGNIDNVLEALPSIDIYFERAFRIMRDSIINYENKIINKLSNNAIIISDSGFQNSSLQRIPVSKDLSSYKEMIILQKLSQ